MDDYNDIDAFEQNHRISKTEGWVGKHLLIALEVTDVAVTGLGTIDGNCYAFVDDCLEIKYPEWRYGITKLKNEEIMRPGQLLCFIETKHIHISDITIRNSPCWSCYFLGCEYVNVRGIQVFNPFNMLNSDGIDIDTSRFVTVSDCIIHTGDDAITLRCCEQRVKDKTMHCEYITVTNCVIRSTVSAFRIGVGNGTIRHARFSNLTVDMVSKLIEFNTSYSNKGCAVIEDINLSNVSCTDADRLMKADVNNGGMVRNITMENIRAETTAMSFMRCADGMMENINLRNIELYISDRCEAISKSSTPQREAYLLEVKNGHHIMLDDVKIFGQFTDYLDVFHCDGCEALVKKDCNF